MKPKFTVSALIVTALLFVGLFGGRAALAAATITVTTTADSIADDGQCSLREAVIAANTDTAVGGCLAGAGADTIQFDPSLPVPAVFSLMLTGAGEDSAATGDLDLTGTVTILGAGQAQTIVDGNGADRVFDIHPAAIVTMSGITVRNGNPGGVNAGGGINVNLTAHLTLSSSLVTDNTAQFGSGIKSVGRLTLTDSAVSANHGDGIQNFGGLATLTNVDVSNNLGGYGVSNLAQASLTYTGGQVSGNANGGIYNSVASATLAHIQVLNNSGAGGVVNVGTATSRLKITSSVVSNNTSSGSGGGIKSSGAQNIAEVRDTTVSSNHADAAGGGIYNNGIMIITGSTIAQNQSRTGGGVDHSGGSLSMTNDTISSNAASDNGGGLYNRGNATLVNVTLTANTANGAGTGGNLFNDAAASLSIKNTIVANSESDGNCFNSGGFVTSLGHNLDSGNTCNFSASGDLTNTNPMLGSLQNNGGSTLTHALLPGSAAIDHGDNTGCPATDQRGISRPLDGDTDGSAMCDIGAFELDGLLPLTATPTVTGTATQTPTITLTVTPTATQPASITSTPTATQAAPIDTATPTATQAPGSKTRIFRSARPYGGWILESSENSGEGGAFNPRAFVFRLGDDALNRQYRAILSFNTSRLPVNATITAVTLRIKPFGRPVGGNPFDLLENLLVDIRKGTFGKLRLEAADFQVAATATDVGAFGKTPVKRWYSATLNSAGMENINAGGITQFRLYFSKDDNDNLKADFMKFFSGKAAIGKPELIITYTVP